MGSGVVVILAILTACEAPHDNPFDPACPSYNGQGSIVGWVKTRTGDPIADVSVYLDWEQKTCYHTVTDLEGFYQFDSVPKGSASVCTYQEGYSSDTASIEVKVGVIDTVIFLTDILPVFLDYRAYSIHSNTQYSVMFEAVVDDEDGPIDIEAVSFWIEGITGIQELDFNDGVYDKEVGADFFPGNTIEYLIGKDCFFQVRDKAGGEVQSPSVRMGRIIYQEPEVIKPVNFEKVGPNPELIWEKPELPFSNTYSIEVFRLQSGQPLERIWFKEGIPLDDTVVTVPVTLPVDNYSWAVWIVDGLGNRSRSKIKGFQVQ